MMRYVRCDGPAMRSGATLGDGPTKGAISLRVGKEAGPSLGLRFLREAIRHGRPSSGRAGDERAMRSRRAEMIGTSKEAERALRLRNMPPAAVAGGRCGAIRASMRRGRR